jgi:hypothetical protein
MKVRKQRGNMHLILGGRKGALQTYINKVKKRVGMAKAGWAVCADRIPDMSVVRFLMSDTAKTLSGTSASRAAAGPSAPSAAPTPRARLQALGSHQGRGLLRSARVRNRWR